MIEYRNVSLCCKVNGNILNDLNFKINDGELFVLIGPSGSGKFQFHMENERRIKANLNSLCFVNKRKS